MPDDGFRYELVQGELRQLNPAGNVHGRVTMSLAWSLAQYVDENQLGTVYAAETGSGSRAIRTQCARLTWLS